MQLLALVSREWHDALMAVLDIRGDPATELFLWACRTGKLLLLSKDRRHELPQCVQFNSMSIEAWGALLQSIPGDAALAIAS